MLQAFDAVDQNIPLRVVAASFQKEPQVLMSHPGQGLDTWEDLRRPSNTSSATKASRATSSG